MIYKFRILSNEVADFIREIEIRSDQTFFDFHIAIQESVAYDKSQMASFFLTDDDWQKDLEITLFEMTDEDDSDQIVMDVALLSEFIKTQRQKLLYTFDYFSERIFFIELVEVISINKDKNYPVCVRSEGDAPVQIEMKVEDENDSYEAFLDDDLSNGISFENIDDI